MASSPTFCMCGRKVDLEGIIMWPLRKIIHIDIDIMLGLLTMEQGMFIVWYTEATIVMKVNCGEKNYAIYMVQLDSMEYRELEGEFMGDANYPFASFYTGGKQFLCLHYICAMM
jgi:hypothetical protein